MAVHYKSDVPAPLAQVRYVLAAIDEYPAWNSLTSLCAGGLRWEMPRVNGATTKLTATVTVLPEAIALTLRRPLLRVEYLIELAAASATLTEVSIATSVSGPRAILAHRLELVDSVRCLCGDLARRAGRLRQAPGTQYLPPSPGVSSPSGERTASLEQLRKVSRELEGGILAIDGSASWCLLDIARRRFLRVEPGSDIARLVSFARWHAFDDVVCDGNDVVIVPGAGAARVRIHHHAKPVAEMPKPVPR